MKKAKRLPNDLTPLNLMAYLTNEFGVCGCSELDEVHASLLRLLDWHDKVGTARPGYDALYPEAGVFFLLVGQLDRLGLVEHGTSARVGFLTDNGRRLLVALRQHGPDDIENASGEAYDGCWYGDMS